MLATLIGLAVGLVSVGLIQLFGGSRKITLYALVLTGIGFLYPGYTWSDTSQLTISIIQAMVFLFIAFYGARNVFVLAAGYFLHGVWDFFFEYFTASALMPPHYDLFCLAVDVEMGIFILLFRNKLQPTV